MARNAREFFASRHDTIRAAGRMSDKKYKKYMKIKKFAEDGKISKKEAKKMKKKGYDQRDLDRYGQRMEASARSYDRSRSLGRDRGYSNAETYVRPLRISRGAGRTLDRAMVERYAGPRDEPKQRRRRRSEDSTPNGMSERAAAVPYDGIPGYDDYFDRFNPVQPTNMSVNQAPVTLRPPQQQLNGGLGQFNTSGLTVRSKLLNV